METKLKPCPFCGSNALLCKESGMTFAALYSVVCTGCGVKIGGQYDPLANMQPERKQIVDVLEAWNRRVNDGEQ